MGETIENDARVGFAGRFATFELNGDNPGRRVFLYRPVCPGYVSDKYWCAHLADPGDGEFHDLGWGFHFDLISDLVAK